MATPFLIVGIFLKFSIFADFYTILLKLVVSEAAETISDGFIEFKPFTDPLNMTKPSFR